MNYKKIVRVTYPNGEVYDYPTIRKAIRDIGMVKYHAIIEAYLKDKKNVLKIGKYKIEIIRFTDN